jgi:hypothetical protein
MSARVCVTIMNVVVALPATAKTDRLAYITVTEHFCRITADNKNCICLIAVLLPYGGTYLNRIEAVHRPC